MKGYTIDSATSKDLDDAIWIDKTDDGFSVFVHIANVAAKIHKDTSFDQKAFDLAETRYFAEDRSKPMFPRRISEDESSLLEGQERDVFTVRIELLQNLAVKAVEFGCFTLTSAKKLSHKEVPEILKDENHELHEQLTRAESLARGLMERRRNAGAFVLYDINHGWITTEEGFVRQLKDTEDTIGQIIVQEFMILANAQMAAQAAEHEIPILWRNHTARAHAPERQTLIDQLATATMLSADALATMRKQVRMVLNRAEYGATLEGHYGLNLPGYLHCTSPIRRFADLITQRQFIAKSKGEPYPYSREELEQLADHLNAKIRAVAEERSHEAVERVTAKAQERLEQGTLSHLEGREYERVVKVLVRSGGFHADFAEDFKVRLGEDRLALLEIYFVLLKSDRENSEWASLRSYVFAWLVQHPSHAPTMLSLAVSLSGWAEPRYETQAEGPDHAACHKVRLKVEWKTKKKPGLKGEAQAVSVKLAKQRAALDLLAKHLSLKVPEYPEESNDTPTQSVPVPPANDNPVSALQEYCQKRKTASVPVYEAQRVGGPDHVPQFTVTVKLEDQEATSDAFASKKAAKKQAAEKLLDKMRG